MLQYPLETLLLADFLEKRNANLCVTESVVIDLFARSWNLVNVGVGKGSLQMCTTVRMKLSY